MRHLAQTVLDHIRSYILTVRDVLSHTECQALIDRIERLGPETATIHSVRGTRVKLNVSNNRVIFDDPELAAMLLKRIRECVPADIHSMLLVDVNERFRCFRYKPGMRFAPHADGAFRHLLASCHQCGDLHHFQSVRVGGSKVAVEI